MFCRSSSVETKTKTSYGKNSKELKESYIRRDSIHQNITRNTGLCESEENVLVFLAHISMWFCSGSVSRVCEKKLALRCFSKSLKISCTLCHCALSHCFADCLPRLHIVSIWRTCTAIYKSWEHLDCWGWENLIYIEHPARSHPNIKYKLKTMIGWYFWPVTTHYGNF